MPSNPQNKEILPIKPDKLNDYLKVYNRNTMRDMGNIGNISYNGLMLVSNIPVLIGAVYNMRMAIPDENNGQIFIDFDARCHWMLQ